MEIIGDNIIRHFTTRKIGEGLTDADSLPTGTVYKNGTATGITVTVTKISTGNYKASFTAAAGSGADQFVIGEDWSLVISATVDSVSDAASIAQGTFDNKRVGALNDIAAGAEMDLVNAPNSTAIAAIQSGLSTFDASSDEVAIKTASITSITTAIEALTSYKRIYGVHYGKFSYDDTTDKLTIYDPTNASVALFVWNLATANQRTSE
jgi:hypothetical protein